MKRIIIFLWLACTAALLHAQSLGDSARAELDEYLETAVTMRGIPGIVALATNSEGIIYQAAFGKQDVANDIDMSTDSIFRIASMTKPVTSAAVMLLVQQGKVGIDDPIEMYLPDLANREVFAEFNLEDGTYTAVAAKNKITIRHLLANSSGLAYSFVSPEIAKLAPGFATSATEFPLLFEPGSRWVYGESTRVLGRLVENVSGMGLYAFMQANIFTPLGMQETFYDIPADQHHRVVTVHRFDGEKLDEDPNPDTISAPHNGDGGLSSTAADYARFIRMFLNSGNGILSAGSVRLMGSNQLGAARVELMPSTAPLLSKPFPLGAGVDTFGLGFQITESQQPHMRAPGSMAWAGIYNTEFWIDPQSGIGAVLLMQYLPFYDDTAIEVLQGFEQRIYQHLE